ncbi:glycine cleavage system protein H, partial [Candidatus Poribacteria bacterium]|nr:glycine cleavage system protein H [Candidatus Poribacteria bacterium]
CLLEENKLSTVKYTTTHEWIEVNDSEGTIGITERALLIYGEIVYVDVSPEQECEQGEIIGRIETETGGNFYLYAPVAGEIYEVNDALEEDVDVINVAPEGDGWICKIYIDNLSELDSLLELDDYETYEEDAFNDSEYMSETDFFENIDDY